MLQSLRFSASNLCRCSFVVLRLSSSNSSSQQTEKGANNRRDGSCQDSEEPWKDPYKHAIPQQSSTFSDYREADVDWMCVQRLLPRRIIPKMPSRDGSVTPSGWCAPRETAPNLPYYIRRGPNHMPLIHLERRRDELNPKTMDFEYVELVNLKGVEGDIFACEQDLRIYVERRLGHPIATHVDELKGKIKVKGADRTLIEQFVYDYEVEFEMFDQTPKERSNV